MTLLIACITKTTFDVLYCKDDFVDSLYRKHNFICWQLVKQDNFVDGLYLKDVFVDSLYRKQLC